MGLDICIYKMIKVPQKDDGTLWTDTELYNRFDPDGIGCFELCNLEPVKDHPDFVLPGAEDYLFKCKCSFYDEDKIMDRLGISRKDGWEQNGMSTDAFYTKKKDQPDPETVEAWFSFVNTRGAKECKKWAWKEYPVIRGDTSVLRSEDNWCIAIDGIDRGYMRKGANQLFYDEDMWDSYPVCLKETLHKHMMRYFDDKSDERYDCPRESFKKLIYDKFEDGKGLCVYYC